MCGAQTLLASCQTKQITRPDTASNYLKNVIMKNTSNRLINPQ